MKRKWYWFIGIIIILIILFGAFLYLVFPEIDCSVLKNDLIASFNGLSRSCSLDTDCSIFNLVTDCISVCGETCINVNANISLIKEIDDELNSRCSVPSCLADCYPTKIPVCKCINNRCESVFEEREINP